MLKFQNFARLSRLPNSLNDSDHFSFLTAIQWSAFITLFLFLCYSLSWSPYFADFILNFITLSTINKLQLQKYRNCNHTVLLFAFEQLDKVKARSSATVGGAMLLILPYPLILLKRINFSYLIFKGTCNCSSHPLDDSLRFHRENHFLPIQLKEMFSCAFSNRSC